MTTTERAAFTERLLLSLATDRTIAKEAQARIDAHLDALAKAHGIKPVAEAGEG